MNHKFCLLWLLILGLAGLCQNASGQSKSNSVYFELGGNGLFASMNYEKKFLKNTGFFFHLGTGIYGINTTYLTIPLGIKYQFKLSRTNSFLDLGMGATYSKADVRLYSIVEHINPDYKNTRYWNIIPSLSYRKVTNRNMVYHLGLTPVINHNGFLPFLGFSIGRSF